MIIFLREPNHCGREVELPKIFFVGLIFFGEQADCVAALKIVGRVELREPLKVDQQLKKFRAREVVQGVTNQKLSPQEKSTARFKIAKSKSKCL